jgi:hypothetical protein
MKINQRKKSPASECQFSVKPEHQSKIFAENKILSFI